MSVLTKQCLLIQVLEPPCVYVTGIPWTSKDLARVSAT
jgi:hypothetical protein